MATDITLRSTKGSALTHDEMDTNLTNLQTTADAAVATAATLTADKAEATALGVANTDQNMGSFTGSTISDNVSAKAAIQALETAVETKANATAVGVTASAANMGTYTGTTIPDNETAKQNLQSLETAVETKANASALGVTSSAANMGTYTGSTITDNQTAKQNIQELETSLETKAPSAFSHATSYSAGSVGAKLKQFVSVKDAPYNALGDDSNDDTAEIQAAIDAVVATGGILYFPRGTYKISAELSITAPIVIAGDGAKSTIIRQTGATANGVNFNFAALIQGGGISGISIEAGNGWLAAGFQGSGSTGVGLKLTNSNGLFFASDIGVHNFDTGIQVLGSYYPQFNGFQVFWNTTAGIHLTKSGSTIGAGSLFTNGKVSNNGFTGTNTASYGIKISASGGDFFKTIDVTSYNKGIGLIGGASSDVLYCFFDAVLADTCLTNNWEFDGTSGKVWSINMVNCWGSYSTNGAGVVVKGSNVDSIKWGGGAIRENGTHGVHLQYGKNVVFSGVEIASNSKLTANTYDGVAVDAGVSDWGLIGCRIGNVASTLTGQLNNINIASGASSNFRIIGNNLNNPGAGGQGIVNGSSVLTWVVSGNLPRQTVGNNTSERIPFTGSSVTSPAAGGTYYLGPAGAYGGVNSSAFITGKPGNLTGFYVAVGAAPGAGETFTYTVYVNAVSTAMTGTITGAGSFTVSVTSNALTLAATDQVALQLVTTGGAAATTHRFVMYFEP